ncbi:MAG TPA: GAF domain-containing sensor histidine kinase, partial [Candidatus Omnitrophica bacterium]|nr:GAF domain-containing sensor histidine kinase [Candidatus Omnitrophota bacterium]
SPEYPEEEFSSIAKFTDRPSAVIDTVIPEPPSTIISPPSVIASHEELKKAHRTLAILYEAGGLLNSVFKVEEVLDKIMDLIFQYLRADRALIMLKEESTSKTTSSGVRLIPKAVRKRDKTDKTELTVSHSIINQVLKEGKSVICSDALEDERFKAKQSIIQYHIHSAMCVPLLTKEKTLGVIYADTLLSKGAFGAEDLKLLSAIGNEAALAIDNARLYEENLKAARLAGIGQAITGMAHYIKNILVGIEGGSTLMDMGIEQKNDTLVNKGWKLVKSATGKVRDLVMDMLTYSKEKEPQLVPCNLNDIVEDVVHLMSEKGEELGIKVNTSLDRDIGQFQLDPQIIHRALLNLINNAFDAMKDGGEVTITTEYRTVYPQEVGGEKGDQLKLSVTDTGPGIPDEVVKTLFTPFHTTTKGLGGTGLGLAVTHKIIKEHGGTIEVESKVGKGTTFHIYLPAKKE